MMLKKSLTALLVLQLYLAPAADAQEASGSGLWQRFSVTTQEMLQGYVWAPLRDMSQALFSAEKSFSDHVSAFVQTMRTDMARIERLAARAGYRLSTITMNPGIIPAISMTFSFSEKITAADAETLRAELSSLSGVSGVLERGIILGLLDLETKVQPIKPDGFRISEVEMALVAIFPEISVSFTRE